MSRPGRLTLPSFAVFGVFFALPLAYYFVISFWLLRSYRLTPDFSFANYVSAYQEYLHAGVFTLVLAFLIALITTLLAFAFAYLVRFRAGSYGPFLLFIVVVTLFGGYLVKIYAWKTILGTAGIVNSVLIALGVTEEPVPWLLYNPPAVVITLVHFLLPFSILPIYASLRGLKDVPLEAARDLGATPSRLLVDIILPQCQPGLFAAFALSFLISAGDYVTPRLVGGPNTFMVGNFVESQFINRLNAPLGSALAFSVLTACLVTLILVRLALRRLLRAR